MDPTIQALIFVALWCQQPHGQTVQQCRQDLLSCFVPGMDWPTVMNCIEGYTKLEK